MLGVPELFFLSSDGRGQRLCLHHRPSGSAARGGVVYVHPFAEEMNKSRRMAALQSRALAAAGFEVLQMDLLGCGDSSGDFGDASWDDWIQDVVEASRWMRQRCARPLWLWGLRAGCLLATEAAQQVGEPCNLLLWQPSLVGKVVLQQFLRLRVAADMVDGQAKGVMSKLRTQLAAGEAVEIAGYRVSPSLAAGLEMAALKAPPGAGQVAWLEVSTRESASLLPASEAIVERWRQTGHAVNAQVVQGPAFWQTSEIEEASELVEATLTTITEAVIA
jgi:uncharacterized protein